MKLFYDLRLGYLVAAPGQETPLASLQAKAGDGEEVILQFGRSSDPTASSVIVAAPTWTAENLAGGTLITIGIKQDGKYSDGTILATSSTFTHSSGAFTYTFALDLNTTAINTALERGDSNAADDIPELDCGFEVTFQVGGSGGWRSSVLPVPFTLYHDILYGTEGTPTNAGDPTQYLLKSAAVEFLPTVTSLTGGTAADLDAIPTVSIAVGKIVQFLDEDPAIDIIRYYRLESGNDAENSPNVIRPDDYATTTNEKIWQLYSVDLAGALSNPMTTAQDIIIGGASGAPGRLGIGAEGEVLKVVSGALAYAGLDIVNDTSPQLGGPLDANSKQIREAKGADVASATALVLGNDGNYFSVTGTTAITSIGTKGVGTRATLRFSGVLTFTHHATDLILPTGASITTAAGDVAVMREYATGDWVCESYQRASGAALLASAGSTTSWEGVYDSLNSYVVNDLVIESTPSLVVWRCILANDSASPQAPASGAYWELYLSLDNTDQYVKLTSSQTLTNKTLTGPTLTNPTITNYTETTHAPAATAAITLNLTNGTVQKITSNGNLTVTLPASAAGKSFQVRIHYGGTHTLTWAGGTNIRWAGGTAPTPTSVNGKVDIFNFVCDGTNTYGAAFGLNFTA